MATRWPNVEYGIGCVLVAVAVFIILAGVFYMGEIITAVLR